MNNQLNALIEKIVSQKLAEAQGIRCEPAVVVSADSSNTKATVRFLNGSEYELLNKTGEVLTAGDSVWIEYRTLPSTGYIALRNGEAMPWKSESLVNYSEEEHLIGTWIDGSDLYEKTVVIPALDDGTTRVVEQPHGIVDLIEVVESRGQLLSVRGGADHFFMLSEPLEQFSLDVSGSSISTTDISYYHVDNDKIHVHSGSIDMSAYKAYVTLRYTRFTSNLPSWFPDPRGFIYLVDSILPSNVTDYAVFARGSWDEEPIHTPITSFNQANAYICWITSGSTGFNISSNNSYEYRLKSGQGTTSDRMTYVQLDIQNGRWLQGGTFTDYRFVNLVKKNGTNNSHIFSSLLLFRKGENSTYTLDSSLIPDPIGYEFIDMT